MSPHPRRSASPRPEHRRRTVLASGVAAAALLVVAVPSASAQSTGGTTAKASGTTTIKLSSAVTSAMKQGRVALRGVSPARRGATSVKLPLTSATIDAASGSGTLNHSGALRFVRRGRSITLKAFRVAVSPSASAITVAIGGSRVRAFTVDTSAVKIEQGRKSLKLSDLGVKLTPIGASRLNRALRIQRFKAGMSVGVANTTIATPGASTGGGSGATVFTSGTSTLSLTEEAKAGLAAGGASLSTVAPATGAGNGPFRFPITGGSVDGARGFAGTTTLAGALQLTAQGQTVTFSDPIVDTANKVVTAVVNGSRVELFALDMSTVRNVAYEGQLVLDGIVVKRAASGPLADPNGNQGGPIGTLRIDAITK